MYKRQDLRRNLGHIAYEAELIEGERPDAAQLAGGIGRSEIHHMAVIVAEFKFRGLDDKTLDALDEAPPIRAAAKLSIGDDLQARRLLQRDDIADATVLGLCEILIVDALGVMVLEGLAQLGRPKEASDAVSYTHLDVYKRQPTSLPTPVTAIIKKRTTNTLTIGLAPSVVRPPGSATRGT